MQTSFVRSLNPSIPLRLRAIPLIFPSLRYYSTVSDDSSEEPRKLSLTERLRKNRQSIPESERSAVFLSPRDTDQDTPSDKTATAGTKTPVIPKQPVELLRNWEKPEKLNFGVDVTSGAHYEATKYVIISKLPSTIVPTDIYRLVSRAAYNEDSIPMPQIEFIRSRQLEFSGRVVCQFRNSHEAQSFVRDNAMASVGGSRIAFDYLYENSDLLPERACHPLMKGASGRSVLLSGLPKATEADMLWIEYRTYDIDTGPNSIENIQLGKTVWTSRWFIKFKTLSEAYRFVRDKNNTFWRRITFGQQYSVNAHVLY